MYKNGGGSNGVEDESCVGYVEKTPDDLPFTIAEKMGQVEMQSRGRYPS